MEKFQQFMEFMKPHWSFLALVGTWAVIGLAVLRRRTAWKKKQFDSQVNFSINYRVGAHLVMRTLLEKPALAIWVNEHGVRRVFAAARKTTEDDPIVVMADRKDQEYMNRAVLNVLSERFAEAFMAAALGVPVRTGVFIYVVTYERAAVMRTLKMRVLLIEERALEGLFSPDGREALVEVRNPVYVKRLKTLRTVYDLVRNEATSPYPVAGRVELGLPLSGHLDGPAALAAAALVNADLI